MFVDEEILNYGWKQGRSMLTHPCCSAWWCLSLHPSTVLGQLSPFFMGIESESLYLNSLTANANEGAPSQKKLC